MSLRAPVLVTRRLPASALAILSEAAQIEVSDVALDPSALLEAVRGRTALVTTITERITDAVFQAAAPSLKSVSNVAVGVDNIDLAAARAHGVMVTNTPDVLTNATAELTWALILSVTRRLGEAERLVRRGDWKVWSLEFMNGTELRGKQLGIVGSGRIGRAVAGKAEAFGMTAVFARHRGEQSLDGCAVISLDELLVSSDVVVLTVPLRPDTRHLMNRRTLARMKRTAYLINTARGAVVDEDALVWALGERLIAGAALDVFENEPAVHPGLFAFENVVLVPHIGSATRETRIAMAELAARNAVAVVRGQRPLTPVA